MSDVAEAAVSESTRWWNWRRFPLVPSLEYRPARDWNASGWWFHWLG